MRSAMAKWLEYGPTGGLAGWRRGFAIAAVAAVFLAVSGAFGMGQLSLLERLAYWGGTLAAGTVWGGLASRFVFPRSDAAGGVWLCTLLYALVIAGPITLLVFVVNRHLLHAPTPLRALISLFVSVALVTLVMTAVNTVCAVLALSIWQVAVTLDADGFEWQPALAGVLYALCGSYLLGAFAGLLLERLSRQIRGTGLATLQLALVVIAAMLAAQFTVSPLLSLLVAGMVARARMGHRLQVEPQLGSGGAALTLLLLLTLGLLSTLDGLLGLWPLVAAIIGARLLAKVGTVLLLARPSGLGWRQSLGLGLALQPASSLPLLLTSATLGWPAHLPAPPAEAMQALLIALTLLQLSGPVWLQLGLRGVARESDARPD